MNNRIAVGFLTKDRVELSRQTILPLLQPDCFDLFWFDGSATEEGRTLPVEISLSQPPRHKIKIHHDVRGGPDAAVAYALTCMLKGTDYDYVGLVENDVLLHPDWFGPTMALFDRGTADGLIPGAVSARCYDDRILIQRDGYAVVHNIGWGQQIMCRSAARIALANMRTGMTSENVSLFCQLSGVDISRYWAFRHMEHMLCADWQNDRILASHGYASLALVPSPVEMIGQDPPLHEQGLKIADKPVEWLRDDAAFERYRDTHAKINSFELSMVCDAGLYRDNSWTYFPHHIPSIGGVYVGDWQLRWAQGFGPFSWRAGDLSSLNKKFRGLQDIDRPLMDHPQLTIAITGPVDFLVSGGETGGQWRLEDLASGYTIEPQLTPEPPGSGFVSLPVPTRHPHRAIRLTALSPGLVFYGLRTTQPQSWLPNVSFDWHTLPLV